MWMRAAFAGQVLSFVFMAPLALAQDLAREAEAARRLLRERELESTARILGPLLEEENWRNSAVYVSALYGKQFKDDFVVPLIARTDTTSTDGHRNMIWHAIAYTRTELGRRFLEGKRKSGTPGERQLADACLAAAELMGIGAQCDLNDEGMVKQVFLTAIGRQTTAQDIALIARLPAIESLSAGKLADGAFEPLRSVTTLTSVGFGCDTPYVNEAVRCLKAAKELSMLDFAGPVTDAAMPDIGDFAKLECLRFRESRITEAGLRHLAGLSRLTTLDLTDTPISDAGLRHLQELREMVHLTLVGTAIKGPGLVHLRHMHKLWGLHLDRTEVDDRALENFREFDALRNVKFLYLEKTRITDAGLTHLAAMTSAEGLHLSGNEGVTSAGIARLRKLANLKWINCYGGRVSDAAAEQFARGRPASFYISYSTSPKASIRYEKGHEPTVETPQSRLLKKLRRTRHDGSVAPEVIDEIAAEGPKMIGPLLAAVKEQHGIYQDVARVFHKLGPSVLDRLVAELRKDPDYRVHSAVEFTLELHGMPLFPKLRQWLFDESPAVRQAAAEAMYDLASVSGTKLPGDLHIDLLKALGDSKPEVRRQAAAILAHFPDKIVETARPLTKAAQADAELNVRMQAAAALGQCVDDLPGDHPLRRQAVDTLSALALKDESFYVRELAVHYLKELADKDERAVRILIRATADEWRGVRDKAEQALNDLGHGALIGK